MTLKNTDFSVFKRKDRLLEHLELLLSSFFTAESPF